MNKNDTVIFLASFGTSILRAAEESYDKIQAELAKDTGLNVLQVYTDDDTAKAVNGINGKRIFTVEEAVQEAILKKYSEIIAVPVFFAEGELYNSLRSRLDFYRESINIRITDAVLHSPKSCEAVADILIKIIKPAPENEYILVGHEASAYNYKGYDLLNENLKAKGYENLHVVKLSERDSLGQAIAHLQEREALRRDAQVEIVPLIVAWGDYMAGELYNSDNSFMWQLRKAGYRTVFTGKGLGEYEEFRKIYTDRFNKLTNE